MPNPTPELITHAGAAAGAAVTACVVAFAAYSRRRPQLCSACSGAGGFPCFVCEGTGEQPPVAGGGLGRPRTPPKCKGCLGRGKMLCRGCGGTGYVKDFIG